MPEKKKKTPTSQSLAADATKGPNETPKGSALSVPPSGPTVAVPLITIDADAGASPKARAAGTALVRLTGEREWEAMTQLAIDARTNLEDLVAEAMTKANGRLDDGSRLASVMADIAVRHVVSKVTGAEVLAMIQGDPELVLEAERAVAATLQARAQARA